MCMANIHCQRNTRDHATCVLLSHIVLLVTEQLCIIIAKFSTFSFKEKKKQTKNSCCVAVNKWVVCWSHKRRN